MLSNSAVRMPATPSRTVASGISALSDLTGEDENENEEEALLEIIVAEDNEDEADKAEADNNDDASSVEVLNDDDGGRRAWTILCPKNAKRQDLWKYFGYIQETQLTAQQRSEAKGRCYVACRLCYERLRKDIAEKADSGAKIKLHEFANLTRDNATKLSRHLNVHHSDISNADREKRATEHLKAGGSLDTFVSYGSRFENACVDWIVEEYLPFLTVERASFRRMISTLNNNPVVRLTREKVTGIVKERAAAGRAQLKELFKKIDFVAITLDKWTSKAVESYLGVTVHFISDAWELEHLCLQCIPTDSEKSTAEDILRDVEAYIK